MAKAKKPTRPRINDSKCKRCNICATFCPKKVFGAKAGAVPSVDNPDACIGCEMCVLRCPDFAVTLEEGGENKGE